MIFISIEDFFSKTENLPRMTKEEELECVRLMKNGDINARERLIESYLSVIASNVKRAKPQFQTLSLVMYYQEALEKAIDSFDFFQENDPFINHLSRHLRQAFVKYIANS